MKNRRNGLIALLLFVSGFGCSQSPSTSQGGSFQKNEPPVSVGEKVSPQFDFKELKSSFGTFSLYTLKAEALKSISEKDKNFRLVPLNLGSSVGVTAYHIENYEISRTVLLVPKIVFRSSINGLRPKAINEGGDNISIQTHFALFDGTSDNIKSETGERRVTEGLKLGSKESLLKELRTRLGGEPNFLANIQCPERITIKGADLGEFQVDLVTPLKSCPSNIFLPAKVVFKKDEYIRFREGFLKNGELSVQTDFSFGTPVTLAYGKLKIRSSLIREQLCKDISETSFVSNSVLAQTLVDTVDKIQKSFDQCIPQEAFTEFKNKIIDEFIDTKIQPECPDSLPICFQLKSSSQSRNVESVIESGIRKEDYLGLKTRYISESLLSDTLSDKTPVLLKQDNPDPLNKPPVGTINNALKTVQEGDWIELTIQKMRQSDYSFEVPKVQNISNPVCLAPFSICRDGHWNCTNPNSEDYNCRNVCSGGTERKCKRWEICYCAHRGGCCEWEDVCRGWSQVCDRRRVCDRLSAPQKPSLPFRIGTETPHAPDFTWICTNQSDSQCDPDQWQDQWQRITKYSIPKVTQALVERTVSYKDLDSIIDGLTLNFSNAVNCSLREFSPKVLSPGRVIFQINNNSNCIVFSEEDRKQYRSPNLSITNAITFYTQFRCGELWEDFAGRRKYTCVTPDGKISETSSTVEQDAELAKRGAPLGIWIPYYPQTEIEAQLRFVGSYFETESEEKRK